MIGEFTVVTVMLLGFLAWEDFKTHKIIPELVGVILLIGLLSRYINNSFTIWFFVGWMLFIAMAWLLWVSKSIGGGDSKVLMCLFPSIPFTSAMSMGHNTILFLIALIVFTVCNYLIYKHLMPKRKYSAYLHVILLAYLTVIV